MRRSPILLVAAQLVALASHAPGHGGVYRGPGATVPPGAPPTTGAPTPTAGPGAGSTTGSWSDWWGFNREPYLDLRTAVHAAGTASRDGDFYLGAGERAQLDRRLAPPPELLHGRVVPALLAALETERSNDLVTAALIALAKVGEAPGELDPDAPDLEAVLRRHLADASQEVAETAAVALGILQGDAQAFALASLLDDAPAGRALVGRESVPHRTRAFAAYGLGLIGSRTEREDVRRFIAQKLARGFAADEGRLHDLRVACLVAFANVPLPSPDPASPPGGEVPPHPASSRAGQVRFALDVLYDEDLPRLVRAHAPYALGRLARGAPPDLRARAVAGMIAPLERFAKYPIEVEVGCVQALAATADADDDPLDAAARAALLRAVRSGQLPLRHEALVALGRVAARPGGGAGAAECLSATRTELLERLSTAKTLSRPWVALSLGLLERGAERAGQGASADALRALRRVAEEAAAPDVVGGACVALGLVPDPAAAPLLERRFAALGDDVARGHVAMGLGLMGARSAVDTLRDVVRGARYRPGLLRDAAIALGLLGDKALVPELVGMLRASESLATQAAVATALGTIGDVRAVDPLLALLADGAATARARAFAAAALGTVGTKDRLPWNTRFALDVNWSAAPPTLHDPASGRGVLDLF